MTRNGGQVPRLSKDEPIPAFYPNGCESLLSREQIEETLGLSQDKSISLIEFTYTEKGNTKTFNVAVIVSKHSEGRICSDHKFVTMKWAEDIVNKLPHPASYQRLQQCEFFDTPLTPAMWSPE